jgi:type I restriction enzyme M protein
VDATRSEVLFVDYIAEHLTPNGRAAVIVPEGIIFQSGTAYKQLREMLVKNYLVAVISLPGGVFNPYSGVKTSILVLDKRLAKKTDAILFAKIDNDGYNLGAQRRPIDKNDLPAAAHNIKGWLESLRNGGAFDVERIANLNLVAKEKIGENGEWSLSGERYRSNGVSQTTFDMVELGDASIFAIESGGTPKSTKEAYWKGGIHWATLVDLPQRDFISQITKTERTISEAGLANSSAKILPVGTVVVSSRATIGRVGIARIPLATNQGFKNIVIKDAAKTIPEFVAYMMKRLAPEMEAMATGGTFKEISKSTVATLKIPLPPLEVQKEIVAEIEGYQKIIDGARQVVENYQPHIPIHPDLPMVELGVACESIMDGTHFSPTNTEKGDRLYITSKNVRENYLDLSNVSYISEEDHRSIYSRCPVKTGDVLYIKDGANTGLAAINTLTEEFSLLSSVAVLRGKPEVLDNRYLAFFLNSPYGRQSMLAMISGVAITRLTLTKLNAAKIPIPDIGTQQAIVAQIETEQRLVNANKELIRIFEDKIKATINRVWGEAEQAVMDARGRY